MSAVQRWHLLYPQPYEDSDGRWVEYADYERVVAELNEAHQKALAAIRALIAEARAEMAEARALLESVRDDSEPRTLTAASPEPGVGSVVLDGNGNVWQLGKGGLWWIGGSRKGHAWAELLTLGPLVLIHDSGKEA